MRFEEYNEAENLADSDLFLAKTNGGTKKVTWSKIKSVLSTSLNLKDVLKKDNVIQSFGGAANNAHDVPSFIATRHLEHVVRSMYSESPFVNMCSYQNGIELERPTITIDDFYDIFRYDGNSQHKSTVNVVLFGGNDQTNYRLLSWERFNALRITNPIVLNMPSTDESWKIPFLETEIAGNEYSIKTNKRFFHDSNNNMTALDYSLTYDYVNHKFGAEFTAQPSFDDWFLYVFAS